MNNQPQQVQPAAAAPAAAAPAAAAAAAPARVVPMWRQVTLCGPLGQAVVDRWNGELRGRYVVDEAQAGTGGSAHALDGGAVKVLAHMAASAINVETWTDMNLRGHGAIMVLSPSRAQALATRSPAYWHLIPDAHEPQRSAQGLLDANPGVLCAPGDVPGRTQSFISSIADADDLGRRAEAGEFGDCKRKALVMVDVVYHLAESTRAQLYRAFGAVVIIGRLQTPLRLQDARLEYCEAAASFKVLDPVDGDGVYTGWFVPELMPGIYQVSDTVVRSERKEAYKFIDERDVGLTIVTLVGAHLGQSISSLVALPPSSVGRCWKVGSVVIVEGASMLSAFSCISYADYSAALAAGASHCHANFSDAATRQLIIRSLSLDRKPEQQRAAILAVAESSADVSARSALSLAEARHKTVPGTLSHLYVTQWQDNCARVEAVRRSVFEPRMADPDRRWIQLVVVAVMVMLSAYFYGQHGAAPFLWWAAVAALPEEWAKRRWPWVRLLLPLFEMWGYNDSLGTAILRLLIHNFWAILPYWMGAWMHTVWNTAFGPKVLLVVYTWMLGYCTAYVSPGVAIMASTAIAARDAETMQAIMSGQVTVNRTLECIDWFPDFNPTGKAEWRSLMLAEMRNVDWLAPWRAGNFSSVVGITTGLSGGVELSALHALGLGLDLAWQDGAFVDSAGNILAADALVVQTANSLPTLQCICGGNFTRKASKRSGDTPRLDIRDRECRARPSLYLVGGFLSPTELPCAFTPCGCGASLEVAFTRYLASDPSLDPEAYRSLIRSDWYQAARGAVRRSFVSIDEFAAHLQGAKRADFIRSMEADAPRVTTMTMMVKADEKVFSLAKPPRPLVFNTPDQLAQTGPMAYSVEREVWAAWDYLFTKWSGSVSEIARTLEEMRETVAYYPHVYTLEVDISAADASSSPWSRDLYDHVTAFTGATVRNSKAVLGDLWEEARAFSYLSSEWVRAEGRELAHSGVAKYGKRLVGKFALGDGQLATGKSRTNLQQTTMLGMIARGVLEDVLGPMSSWMEKHTDRVYASVKTGDDDLTYLGFTSEICVATVAQAMRCRWRQFGYDVKLSLRPGFPDDTSMCSCYFYPAVVNNLPLALPFQKLGRFFMRSSTIATSTVRRRMEPIVAGMVKGYEAQASWLTPVRLWCDTMRAQIEPQVYAAAEAMLPEAAYKLMAPTEATTSGQLDAFIGRLYNLTHQELIDLYADIMKLKLGKLLRSPVAERIMARDSE